MTDESKGRTMAGGLGGSQMVDFLCMDVGTAVHAHGQSDQITKQIPAKQNIG
jgi:hypothetical protein